MIVPHQLTRKNSLGTDDSCADQTLQEPAANLVGAEMCPALASGQLTLFPNDCT